MATILRALHLGLGEYVALKVLLPRYRRSTELVSRFRREARAVARLRSEHVARVLDFDSLEDGSPYLAMELLDGMDLETRLLEEEQIPTEQAIDLMLQACEAVAEAHALGIIHRDLKPQNLFVTAAADGRELLKVIDFGIAKMLHAGAGLTSEQVSMGTPHYMSPEQLRASGSVDARSDIWALGVILHELLTGRNVFDAQTVGELLALIETSAPRLSLEPHHAAGLADVIGRCLAPSRDERFASALELAEALAPFGGPSAPARVASLRRVQIAAQRRGPTSIDDDAVPASSPAPRGPSPSVPTLTGAEIASARAEAIATKRHRLLTGAVLVVLGLCVAYTSASRESPARLAVAPAAPSATQSPDPSPAPAPLPPPVIPVDVVAVQPPPPTRATAKPASSTRVATGASHGDRDDRDRYFNTRK
jgi:serine/threonine-protein kinase